MSENVFFKYSRYYDLLYRDKDYLGECEYVKNLLANYNISSGELLEFGSGTGKHGLLLADNGFKVHGIERSAEMVSLALQGNGFSCQVGDIREIDMGRRYDAVLSLFHVVSYQTSNSDLNRVLARAADHLGVGGLFVFDVWYTPAVLGEVPRVRVKRMADEQINIVRLAEPKIHSDSNCVEVNYTIFCTHLETSNTTIMQESHLMRHFSLPEIDLAAQANGFVRRNAEEFLTGKDPSETTWGVCVVLEKVQND